VLIRRERDINHEFGGELAKATRHLQVGGVRARLLILTQLVECGECRTDLVGVLGFRVDVGVLKVANQRGIFGQ
jgi:hypothetical protein